MKAGRARRLAALALALAPGVALAESPTGAPEEWPAMRHDSQLRSLLLVEQLEWRINDGDDLLRWEGLGWIGGDYYKLWVESEGEQRTAGSSHAEIELLVGRMVLPYWDLRLGVRQDLHYGAGPDRERTFAALGAKGLAPLWFEVAAALYLSDDGDLSARLEASYDLLLTQRLVLQPRLELNAAAHDTPKFEIERGVNDVEIGLRLRYEIRREIAPYVGVNWVRKLGNTAHLATREGEEDEALGFVAGLRLWF